MLGEKLSGIGIQCARSKKNGCVRTRHPMTKSSRSSGLIFRYLAIRARISIRDRAPFASLKASHATEHGIELAWAKTPPPTMKLLGECSLKRKSSPGRKARKLESDGDQKFTSGTSACRRS